MLSFNLVIQSATEQVVILIYTFMSFYVYFWSFEMWRTQWRKDTLFEKIMIIIGLPSSISF